MSVSGVPALIPLSLFEGIRNLDNPVEDGLDELADEIVAKRLGLSPTVAAQIARYQRAARRHEPVPRDEAVAVFRLVGRRPDATLVFADGGRRAARHAARVGLVSPRAALGFLPSPWRRRVGLRASARIAQRVFRAELSPGVPAEVQLREPLSLEATPDGSGCGFFGAAFNELLRVLAGVDGAMRHVRCGARGDDACLWRATLQEGYE